MSLRKQQRKEQRAFKKIVQKRTLATRRKSYAEEAEKVAEEKGRELARRPSFGKRVVQRAKVAIAPRQPIRRPVRRAPVRTPVRRTMRRAAVKRRTTMRRRKPVRRTMRRAATQQQETQQQPFDIGNLI